LANHAVRVTLLREAAEYLSVSERRRLVTHKSRGRDAVATAGDESGSRLLSSTEEPMVAADLVMDSRARRALRIGCICCALFALPRHAAAQSSIDEDRSSSDDESAAHSAEQGAFLVGTMAPAGDRKSPGVAFATGGYDSARREPLMTSTGDMHVAGPLDLRVGLTYTPEAPQGTPQVQPNVGARINLLTQSRQGINLSTGLFYRRERYSGDDGVVQAVLAVSRRFGRLGLFGNLAIASDPTEGDDRDGEVALAMLYETSAHLQLGLESKCRFDLWSSDPKRAVRNDPVFESASGPVLQYAIGPLALLVQTGLSTLSTNQTRIGAIVLGGLGAAY
jgi:hypothetical protein